MTRPEECDLEALKPCDSGSSAWSDPSEAMSSQSQHVGTSGAAHSSAKQPSRCSESLGPNTDWRGGSVLVLMPKPPWGNDWAAASALAAPVIRARVIRKTRGPQPVTFGDDHLVPTRRLEPSRVLWPLNVRINGRALVRAVDRLAASGQPISLVQSHFYANSIGLPYLLAQRGIPYVVTEHNSSLTFLNPNKEISLIGSRIATSVYESASSVLPVSHSLASDIRRRGLPGNLEVVPNPVDTDVFTPQRSGSGPRIVTTARLAPVKRLDVLLRAVADMVATGSDVCLDIIGDGPSRASLVELAHDIGIAQRVTFHGWVDKRDIPPILGRGTVFALTSHAENLPVAMLEALSCGLPVVGPRIAGIPEIVDGAPGAVFDPDDEASLVNSLLRWSNPSNRERQAARKVAVERYSIKVIGRRLSAIYRRAIDP